MAVLTPDYERIQNGQPQDFATTQEYREDFKNQDIASAQALITSDNNYLVMDADKLNDLCDTINYMQQIWIDDKEEFVEKYFRLTNMPELYDSSRVYAYGDLVTYNNNPYICISEQATGSWQDYRWFRIGRDDIGLDFVETYTTGVNELLVGVLIWQGKLDYIYYYVPHGGTIGYAYPNIRYRASNDIPYTGEIYITDWNGGEG